MSEPTAPAIESPGKPLTTPEHPLLLFFDGDCSFCTRWIIRVKEADKSHRIRFAKNEGPTFLRVAKEHPELAKVDSVVLAIRRSDGRNDFFVRSTAIRKLIAGLPGFQIFFWILNLVPTPLSDLGYRIFSKLRTPLFGKWHHDRPPIEQDRELFVD
jgi:predicted DCC family thiol-disulfide oxidoreductase YuxK